MKTLITTRDYTLAQVEGQIYRLIKLGTLSIVPARQEVVRVAPDGKITKPDHPYDRHYLLGVAVMDERLSARRGGMYQK
ncbi:MAG: hypothetical protein ACRCXB_23005 [Aeromonadaceae bacterium]